MSIPVVKECCCCCSLESGATSIGCSQILMASFSIVQGFITLAISDEHTPKVTRTIRTLMAIMDFGTGVYSIVLGVVLLVGVLKRRQECLQFWVIISIITTIISTIGIFMYITMVLLNGATPHTPMEVTYVLFSIAYTALCVYFIIVVSSLRKEMIENEESSA